jgi:hypothetical protein
VLLGVPARHEQTPRNRQGTTSEGCRPRVGGWSQRCHMCSGCAAIVTSWLLRARSTQAGCCEARQRVVQRRPHMRLACCCCAQLSRLHGRQGQAGWALHCCTGGHTAHQLPLKHVRGWQHTARRARWRRTHSWRPRAGLLHLQPVDTTAADALQPLTSNASSVGVSPAVLGSRGSHRTDGFMGVDEAVGGWGGVCVCVCVCLNARTINTIRM